MRICYLLIFFLLATGGSRAQQADSVRLLIDSALNVMERRAINSHHLNWPVLRDSVFRLAGKARTYREAFPALAYAFDRLEDKHGWLTINDSTHVNRKISRPERPLSTHYKNVFARGPRLYNGVVAGCYAYISIHFFGGQTEAEMNAFAQRIQDSLCRNMTPAIRGLIIDLRLNAGGNGYPMYQGLANVLGDGPLIEGVNGRGQSTGWFAIRRGLVTLHGNYNDSVVLRLERRCGNLSELPVAVLVGPATGSSGEQLAIAFTSRKNTVLIGEHTAGYVTANNGFLLPGADNGIVLAEGRSRNRTGKLFVDDVQPDIIITGGDHFDQREKDAKVRAALRWLDGRLKGKKGARKKPTPGTKSAARFTGLRSGDNAYSGMAAF